MASNISKENNILETGIEIVFQGIIITNDDWNDWKFLEKNDNWLGQGNLLMSIVNLSGATVSVTIFLYFNLVLETIIDKKDCNFQPLSFLIKSVLPIFLSIPLNKLPWARSFQLRTEIHSQARR